MKGSVLKQKLELAGYYEFGKDLAIKIGIKESELEKILMSKDVSSSDLEKIQKRLSLPAGFFFEDYPRDKESLGCLKVEPNPTILNETQYYLHINLKEDEKLIYIIIVSISSSEKYGRIIEVFTLDNYTKYRECVKDETIFYLFKNDCSSLTRYIDENGRYHDCYVGKFGLRIVLDSQSCNGEFNLMLFKDKEKKYEKKVNFSNFEKGFNNVWAKYEEMEDEMQNHSACNTTNL